MKSSLALLAASAIAHAAPLPIAIGTNTGGNSKSEGIYLSSFDPGTGEFGEVKLGAKYQNPGFLALHPTKPLLYSVGRSGEHPRGSLSVFKLGAGPSLEFAADTSALGWNPCHLAVDPTGSMLASANYSDGTTAAVKLDANGMPVGPGFSQKIEGTGANKSRQEGPHAHGVYFRGKHLLVPDLGLDKVLTYTMDPATAKPVAPEPAAWSSAPGAGPRHMDFSPDGKHAYVVNELDNTVAACRFDDEKGTLETIGTVPTLPADWTGESTTAEIQVHPGGKYVYASNRGHDSIAVFARDTATGGLTSIQIAPCGGKTPRHFTLSPDGKWLLCAHQESNTISALPLDPATGKLGEPKSTVPCPTPICIVFLPVEK
ncbi:lactonase family protein [Luteolibacter flavescens]|nr:lactonase family protein [Luteolibacter flavescens]